jgi:hypothetical protein
MQCGVTVEMRIDDENPQPVVAWTPGPPFTKERLNQIMAEYIPWRDDILEAFAKRAGKTILVATPGGHGWRSVVTVFHPDVPPVRRYL